MLKKVTETNKHVMPESFFILDERAIADQTVLLVIWTKNPRLFRVLYKEAYSAMARRLTGHMDMEEYVRMTAQKGDEVLRFD